MRKMLGLAVALVFCFIATGCEVDDLKKELEGKNAALAKCEADRTAISKKVQEMTSAAAAKDIELKTAQESLSVAQSDLAASRTAADTAKSDTEAARTELAGVQAQLKQCTDAAEAAKKGKKK